MLGICKETIICCTQTSQQVERFVITFVVPKLYLGEYLFMVAGNLRVPEFAYSSCTFPLPNVPTIAYNLIYPNKVGHEKNGNKSCFSGFYLNKTYSFLSLLVLTK